MGAKVGHVLHLLFKSLFVKKERNTHVYDTPNLQNTWAPVICIVVSFHDLYLFYGLYFKFVRKHIKC